jgi:hypothetical protein
LHHQSPPRRNARKRIPKKNLQLPNQSVLSPTFKLVFLCVLFITLCCGTAQILLAAIWPAPTPNQHAAFEAMSFAWKLGLGAIFGLLGAKLN